jgi:Holliday junction DNA helicase RuvA
MISSLTGTVTYKTLQGVEIQAGQVGYWLLVSSRLAAELTPGQKTTLYTSLVVGEKSVDLYGFSSRQEIGIFRLLISVSGVGPRTALQIFNVYNGEEIEGAIDKADVAFFQGVKGIGKKTAQRLIVDLKATLDRSNLQDNRRLEEEESTVYQALIRLGFAKDEIALVIGKIDKEKSDEEKITQALRLISNHD